MLEGLGEVSHCPFTVRPRDLGGWGQDWDVGQEGIMELVVWD